MHLLEPQTAGQFERGMNRHPQNARRPVGIGLNRSAEPHAPDAADSILSL
jgi:hypothetical protein